MPQATCYQPRIGQMSKSDDVHAAFTALRDPRLAGPELMPVRLAKACVRVLPISGSGISLYTAATMRIPVGASDDDAAVAESLQFTAAQGPCFDALRTGRMVVATEPVIARWWPDFHDKLVSHTAVRGIIAAPLGDGPAGIGVLDLYCDRSADVQSIDLFEVHSVAQYITEVLVQEQLLPALRRGSMWDRARWLGNPGVTGRSQVLMAMGMVSVALSLNLDDALAILRARAFVTDSTLDSVAHDVIKGELALRGLAPNSNS
jgi:hypothetical protein